MLGMKGERTLIIIARSFSKRKVKDISTGNWNNCHFEYPRCTVKPGWRCLVLKYLNTKDIHPIMGAGRWGRSGGHFPSEWSVKKRFVTQSCIVCKCIKKCKTDYCFFTFFLNSKWANFILDHKFMGSALWILRVHLHHVGVTYTWYAFPFLCTRQQWSEGVSKHDATLEECFGLQRTNSYNV